jgi:pimeloyl-ACP methyl ester carboxylesterase
MLLSAAPATAATPAWRTFPAPAPLPAWNQQGRVEHDGASIWWASFGAGPPVILLHGGDASSDIWGDQVPALIADGHRVIVIDSRGHGRSTRDARPLTYVRLESDVIAVMDAAGVSHAAVVGWSDGAIIALIMAMHDPARVTRVFAFGANMDVTALRPLGALAATVPQVQAWLASDYDAISPTPGGFALLERAVLAMQTTQPNYAAADLAAIRGPQIAIVDGDHEEFIRRRHTVWLARTIPGAQLIILPGVSHFAPVQAPDVFNAAMLGFLDGGAGATPNP